MALSDCPECDKPISTAATACPHCGCPLRGGKKKKSYLAELLLVFGLVVVFALSYGQEDPNKRTNIAGIQNAMSAPRCDAKKAMDIVGKLVSGGMLLKVEPGTDVSHVYTLEPWRGTTLDDKKTIDNAIQCYLTNGAVKGATIVVYYDGRSGKELATSDQYGFRME